jgi:hypothetical protein
MKKALSMAALAVALAASSALAGQGSVGIFADVAGTNCNLPDPGPGLTQYYIVHVNTTGSTACQFSAPKPACFTAMYLSDTNLFAVTIGNSQMGTSVGYGTCRVGPTYVMGINYFTNGQTAPCCYYPVLPDPLAVPLAIRSVDCDFEEWSVTGGTGIIKSGPTCHCGVAAEESTWGQVKALYAE